MTKAPLRKKDLSLVQGLTFLRFGTIVTNLRRGAGFEQKFSACQGRFGALDCGSTRAGKVWITLPSEANRKIRFQNASDTRKTDARSRTRTGTGLLPGDFKSPVSTISPSKRMRPTLYIKCGPVVKTLGCKKLSEDR
jgi:hypothetical protein